MYSDFLLNIMRDILPVRPYLRLVLMTADPDPKELQVFYIFLFLDCDSNDIISLKFRPKNRFTGNKHTILSSMRSS